MLHHQHDLWNHLLKGLAIGLIITVGIGMACSQSKPAPAAAPVSTAAPQPATPAAPAPTAPTPTPAVPTPSPTIAPTPVPGPTGARAIADCETEINKQSLVGPNTFPPAGEHAEPDFTNPMRWIVTVAGTFRWRRNYRPLHLPTALQRPDAEPSPRPDRPAHRLGFQQARPPSRQLVVGRSITA